MMAAFLAAMPTLPGYRPVGYVINHNLGKDIVAAHVEAHAGTPVNPARRWEQFGRLISSPRLPSGLTRPR